jgi:hypothetical protein
MITVLLVANLAIAQDTGAAGKRKAKSNPASQNVSAQLSQMQKAMDAQQQQIQQLIQQLQGKEQQLETLQQQMNQIQSTVTQTQQKADSTASQAAQQQRDVTAVKSDVDDLKTAATNTTLAVQETQKNLSEAASPMALHFKGITITPGGFLAAETVWRQKALGSDINTPFNAIPFSGASQSNMSEFFGSGRQSRVSMLAEGKLSNAKLTGYVEADFLSAGVTSNNNQSNSYTLRQRQVWGQAALESGWSFTGGQMWSLVTETRKGMDNRTEALPMTIDPQYHVGFSWARQYGFRVVKDFGDKFWLGLSLENPQATLTTHGNIANFLVGSAGVGGGLYNLNANYSFNPSPDIIVKAVMEPGWGHYEVFGVISHFRDRIFPNATATTPSASGAYNNSATGAGVGANVRVSMLQKHVDAGLHFMAGKGVGRYGTSGLPDLTVRPDGVLALVQSYQSLATLEWHSKKWDLYANVGGEYAGRSAFVNGSAAGVGYGSQLFNNSGCSTEPLPGSGGFSPGSLSGCTGDTRNIMQGTVGFWYRFYKGPKGTIQWGPQYSYLVRNTWSGVGGIGPHSTEPMVFTSFRYYLP